MGLAGAKRRRGRFGWIPRLVVGAAGLLALAGCDAVLGIPDDLHPETTSGSAGSSECMTMGGSDSSSGSGGGIVAGGGPTLAIRKLLIGDTLENGQVSTEAWRGYGFNLDCKESTAKSVDLCKPAPGGTASTVYPDGNDGIDNSFGKLLLPIYKMLVNDLSGQINNSIDNGTFTILVHIGGLEAGGTGKFASGAYIGAMEPGSLPNWMGADAWKVRSDCLIGKDLSTPVALYSNSQVTLEGGQRVYSSVNPGSIALSLEVAGVHLVLPISNTRISMVLSSDNTKATSGRIGGVINTEMLLKETAKVIGAVDSTFCPPSEVYNSFAQDVRKASDILSDGTQDPSKTCDAISIGIGFEADAALLSDVFDPIAPTDPCQ